MIPNPAPADSGFRLYLPGFSAPCLGCNHAAYRESVRPMGCAMAYEIFGPTFKLPALPAGTCRVKVERLSKQSAFEGGILEIVGPTVLGKYHRIPSRAPREPL